MVTVRIYRILPMTGRLPQQDIGARTCDSLFYGITLEMTASRCACTLDDKGHPPGCDCLKRDVAKLTDDAAAMWRALRCCFSPQLDDVGWAIGNGHVEDDWSPIGPAGGCMGGRMRVTIGVSDCDCD